MKHFKVILTSMRVIVMLLLAIDVVFMVKLYDSIKERYINDVEQCLSRADQIEIVDRIVDAGLVGDDGVVWLQIGLQKSDVGTTMDARQLREMDYSQRFRRVDKQLMAIIAQDLHDDKYADRIGQVDIPKMEEAFRRDLNFSDYYPEEVHIVKADARKNNKEDLWEIGYRVNNEMIYYAYISPLTKNILNEMGGVIITSVLILLVLTFGFWYLLHIIDRQRTIEEMKDDFTSNMTHELKTPIAIAYAANDALLQFPDANDEERTKKYLTAALDQLSKLSGLVESILSLSMERRKHLSMRKEKIKLKDFLRTIAEQQKIKSDKPCTITVECSEETAVEADPAHFSNVIGNLIDNSIKYSGDSVAVVITADSSGLSVADNGVGIPEKCLPHIWSKFYRVPRGNCSEVRGYGIGLFYVQSIVDKHGWTIKAESEQGKGSKFTITFNRQ